MIRTVCKPGNSSRIVLDFALLELAHPKPGDQVNVEVHAGGTTTLTPLRPHPPAAEITKTVKSVMKDYARTMKKLA